MAVLKGHQDAVESVALSPDNTILASPAPTRPCASGGLQLALKLTRADEAFG